MSVPNLAGKHGEKALFGPKEFLEYKKSVGIGPRFEPPKSVILCYQRDLMDFIERSYRVSVPPGSFRGLRLLVQTHGSVGVAGNFGFGAPIAVAVMEDLIAFGVREFLSIGYAGTIQKHIEIGDTVVCDRAVRDEGTSYHYLEDGKYARASEEMTERLKTALTNQKLKFTVATSWTTDAPYRETKLEIERYRAESVATVDMEASALFALAQYRGVSIGSAFTISDSLADLQWKPCFKNPHAKRGLQRLFRAALEALSTGS
jgi:uridine phosphorylase